MFMRPVKDSNSALKTPLNEILGYQGNIRVLRCLADKMLAMSYSELADRTGISVPGIHKVVNRLAENGCISYKGSGRRQLISIRREHPLCEVITELFKQEKDRFEALKMSIRREIENLEPQPKSAWISGKVVQGSDQYGDPLEVTLLGEVKTIDKITSQLMNRFVESETESKFDVTIEVTGLTPADLDRSRKIISGGYNLLWGMDPIFFVEGRTEGFRRNTTHDDRVQISLKSGEGWTELLKKYPEIIPRTVRDLEARISETNSGVKEELKEWKHLLESMSMQRLVRFLESDSERAVRLRQSNPFWRVLKEEERIELERYLETELHES